MIAYTRNQAAAESPGSKPERNKRGQELPDGGGLEDSVRQWLQRIGQIPLLSPEQEVQLAMLQAKQPAVYMLKPDWHSPHTSFEMQVLQLGTLQSTQAL